MTISVIICAYTMARWDDILAAVASLRTQHLPATEILLVIDHNSELLARCKAEIAGVIVIENNFAQGLSGSRNTGIAASKGSLIAFLDDDAEANPEWLCSMCQHFSNPLVLGTGAASLPLWLGTRPRWFPDEFLWVVGCSYTGIKSGRSRNVLGSAMCVRREVFERVGGFDPSLGRTGSSLPISCEETEFCMRANRGCAPGWFVVEATATIRHKVSGERLTFGYFLKRCLAEGISKARILSVAGASGELSVERSYVYEVLGRGFVRGIADTVLRFDAMGIARAFAIFAGLAATTAAFVYARIGAGPRGNPSASGGLTDASAAPSLKD